MANAQEVDLMAFGTHCAKVDCRKLDFLPFKCNHCGKDFCHLHHEPKEHTCSSFDNQDHILPTCPLCGKKVALSRNETINDQVERHITSGCSLLLAEKRKRNQCSQSNCKQRSLVPFTCNACYKDFCVRHRHSWDHSCIAVPTSKRVTAH